MSKTAIILGASGLTGSILLEKLLADERYATIKLFSRKASGISHPKVKEFVMDLFQLEDAGEDFKGDEVFCCIGTTKKKTPDQKEYHKIDFGIPVAAAKLCMANNIETMVTISSMGANVKSSIFYSRTKGEMEQAVLQERLSYNYILRPSLIKGDRKEKRKGEKITAAVVSFFDLFMLGGMKKYRSIKAERIAEAMVKLANDRPDLSILDSGMIQKIADLGID
jgi:uncharacterized protein YbjT (DUF2867 family)